MDFTLDLFIVGVLLIVWFGELVGFGWGVLSSVVFDSLCLICGESLVLLVWFALGFFACLYLV